MVSVPRWCIDGSDGRREIYPSIEETTTGMLRSSMTPGSPYYPVTGKHPDSTRLDAIESVYGIMDDGQKSWSGELYYASQ